MMPCDWHQFFPLTVSIKDNNSRRREVFASGGINKTRSPAQQQPFSSADTFITSAHLRYFHFWHRIRYMQSLLFAGSLALFSLLCLFLSISQFAISQCAFCLSLLLLSASQLAFLPLMSHTLSMRHVHLYTNIHTH